MNDLAIKVSGLTKKYADITAVDHIDFEVEKGKMIGFLGVNGAGKSTSINMMTTILKVDEGECIICGHRLGTEDMAIREKIGIVYQVNCLDEILTVRENLICRGVIHNLSKKACDERIEELTKTLRMEDILDRRYRKLSGGQKRRAEIAAALMHEPEILFLDEPTTGLDPATRIDVWNAIEDIKKTKDMTVFLTTHYMEEAATADQIIVIDHGRIKAQGTPFELKNRFAKDRIRIYVDDCNKEILRNEAILEKYHISVTNFGLEIEVSDTLTAPKILSDICEKYKDIVTGTEIILGNMDDVFLNVVGEKANMEENK